jgi:hypothetical protein
MAQLTFANDPAQGWYYRRDHDSEKHAGGEQLEKEGAGAAM